MLKVKSEFTPSGDQPTAIASLVDGLESGLRFQTLLGATGTGKSVAWHEPVSVEVGGRVWRGPIGELIDGVFGPEPLAESEELPPPEPMRVLAWNAETGETAWRTVTALTRHEAPETLHRLTTACGRDVTVTAVAPGCVKMAAQPAPERIDRVERADPVAGGLAVGDAD